MRSHLDKVTQVDLLGQQSLQVPDHSFLVDGTRGGVDGLGDVRPGRRREGGGGRRPYFEITLPGPGRSCSVTRRLRVSGSPAPTLPSTSFSGEGDGAIFLGVTAGLAPSPGPLLFLRPARLCSLRSDTILREEEPQRGDEDVSPEGDAALVLDLLQHSGLAQVVYLLDHNLGTKAVRTRVRHLLTWTGLPYFLWTQLHSRLVSGRAWRRGVILSVLIPPHLPALHDGDSGQDEVPGGGLLGHQAALPLLLGALREAVEALVLPLQRKSPALCAAPHGLGVHLVPHLGKLSALDNQTILSHRNSHKMLAILAKVLCPRSS